MRPIDAEESAAPQTGSGARPPVAFASDDDGQNALLRYLPVALLVTDASSGRVLEVNEACLSIFGVAREEIMGRTLAEAGVDLVVEFGRKGRAMGVAEAQITDTAGARVSCRLRSSTVTAGGARTVISVLLDDQFESASKGIRRKEAPEPEKPRPAAAAARPLVLLVSLLGSGSGSTAEMLQLLGFEVVRGGSPGEVFGLMPQDREPSMLVVDCPQWSDDCRAARDSLGRAFPSARTILLVESGNLPEDAAAGSVVIFKPLSINDLADAASRS